jgi:outer membrane protein insertion porin family
VSEPAAPEVSEPAAPAVSEPAAPEVSEPAAPEVSVSPIPKEVSGTITSVRVEGLRRVEEAAIQAAIGLRAGEILASYKIRRDLESIYETGFVDDVVVDVSLSEDAAEGASDSAHPPVVVTFRISEKPAVREVTISGNKKLDEDALREVIDIPAFAVLNRSAIKQNIQRMRDKYLEKGFYLVEIDPKIHEVADDVVELEFVVKENKKVRVQRIDIAGNVAVPDGKIRRYMQTKQAGILPWLTNSGTFNEAMLEMDAQIIKQVFLEEGHVDVKIEPPSVYLSPDRRFIYVTIHLTEGPKYQLGKISIQGDFTAEEGLTKGAVRQIISGDTAKNVRTRFDKSSAKEARRTGDSNAPAADDWDKPWSPSFFGFLPRKPMRTGDAFKLSTMQSVMGEVTDLYGNQGYAFTNVVPNTETHPEERVVDVTFNIDKGEKVWIGQIDITGNDPTFDKVLRREIPINEGELYSTSKIKEARARLERLGYFETVEISTPRGDDPKKLDMKVNVTEQPTGSFSVGAGFSNLENFVFTANVSKNNFLGMGYVMSAAANLSSLRQQGNVQLFDPYFMDSRWTLRVDGYSISKQFIEDEYQRGGSFAVGKYVDVRDDVRLEAIYTIEDTGLNSIDAYKARLFGGQMYRNGLASSGGLALNIDKRNNRINATKGVFSSLSSTLTGGWRTNEEQVLSVFGGDFNFYELKANLRTYYPVIPDGDWLIFKYNTTLGHMGSTDGTMIPYIHRYRAGGINSVRGYDWYSLGPSIRGTGFRQQQQSAYWIGSDDPTAADDRLVVGGTETWINNFELEVPIVRQAGISTVVFFDAGNAFGDPWGSGSIDLLKLRTAYGFGVRWFSPMGPLRFEWGFPINPREDERRAVFDFSIGSLF